MEKTLVLVVDRDDDYGVKAKVQSPVIGVNNCMDAASQFGIADPEDSDLNALYAAISVCLELQDDGHDAEVALICGDQRVGHRSDLALIDQLQDVLDEVEPSSVVLVGDGAEDEYIYPIISSRAHVDSVRKVFVKQAPGLEGSLYIFTRMLSDPGKRKRFLAPLGSVMVILSLFFILPQLYVYHKNGDFGAITSMSGSLALMTVGVVITFYGMNVGTKFLEFKEYISKNISKNSTGLIFLCLSVSVVLLGAIWAVMDMRQFYNVGGVSAIVYFFMCMIWPVAIAFYIYAVGRIIHQVQTKHTFPLSSVFICMNITSIALVVTGILDLALDFIGNNNDSEIAYMEIVTGVVLSVLTNFIKSRVNRSVVENANE